MHERVTAHQFYASASTLLTLALALRARPSVADDSVEIALSPFISLRSASPHRRLGTLGHGQASDGHCQVRDGWVTAG